MDPWPPDATSRAAVVLQAIQVIRGTDADVMLIDLLAMVWPRVAAREQ
jgi:hypothetical protein